MCRSVKSQMFRCFVSVLLILGCGTAHASEWWSLAAFKNPANAERESGRINSAIDVDTSVAHSGDLYRVVLKKDRDPAQQKTLLERIGITPWAIADAEVGEAVSASMMMHQYSWVLASFMDSAAAEALAVKLQADGISNVKVATAEVNGIRYYRVVQGPFAQKADQSTSFAGHGLADGWWLYELVTNQAPSSDMAMVKQPPIEPIAAVVQQVAEPVAEVSPPKAGEKLRDYCLYRANRQERAIYCGNDVFNRVGGAQARAKSQPEADSLFYCATLADDMARQAQCSRQ